MHDPLARFVFSCLSLLLLLCASRCKEEPQITPCFTVEVDTFRDPREPVQFRNCSQGATSYLWDFGDGVTSTEAEPRHTFAQTGYHTIRLTAMHEGFEEVYALTTRVEYPRFKAIRVVEMPVINPANGQPWAPDSNGLDLSVYLESTNTNPFVYYNVASDIALPYTFLLPEGISIGPDHWFFRIRSMVSGPENDLLFMSLSLDSLLVSPTKVYLWDSNHVEIEMVGS